MRLYTLVPEPGTGTPSYTDRPHRPGAHTHRAVQRAHGRVPTRVVTWPCRHEQSRCRTSRSRRSRRRRGRPPPARAGNTVLDCEAPCMTTQKRLTNAIYCGKR